MCALLFISIAITIHLLGKHLGFYDYDPNLEDNLI